MATPRVGVPLPLRGRSAELAAIDEALANARDGKGAVVLVEGGAGLGKTRILEEAASFARQAGMRVGFGRTEPDDEVVPVAPLMAALFDGPEPLLDRAALAQVRALRDQRYWLLLELEALLERAALQNPLLVCLDDVHWADAGTIEALRVLPARLVSLPVVWIAAYRTGQASATLMAARAELAEVEARRILLEPLEDAAVRDVVGDVLKAEADPALVELAGNAHGVPFLLVELLRGLVDEDLVRVDGARAILIDARLPARVGESMRQRLERLSPPTRRAAVVASVLGRSFRFDALAAMLDLAPTALLEPIEELTRADILTDADDHLAFRHDIIRQAVLDSIPAAARRALDRQAAEVLLEAGALPIEIATRLTASAEPGDRMAITTLHRAAQSLGPTDPGTASDLTRRALALTTDDAPEREQLVVETAILLHAAGRAQEGREFAASALRAALGPEQEAEARLGIAQMYSIPGDVRVESGELALALPGLSEAMRARHLATLVLNLAAAGQPGAARAAEAEAEAAIQATGDISATLSLELGRLALDELGYRYASMLGRLERIDRLCAAAGEAMPARAAAWFRPNALVGLDRLDEALEFATSELAAAQRDRQGWIIPRWEICRGWLLLQQGRLSDAGAALEGALDGLAVPLAILPDAAGLLALGRIAIHTGDARLSQRCTDVARVTLAVDKADTRHHLVWLLALQAMARGEATPARDELRALAHADASVLPQLARDVWSEPELARIALAAGDQTLAQATMSDAEERAALNPDVDSIAAAAAHCRGLLQDNPDELAGAVELLDTGSRPLMLASVLEDLGRVLVKQARTGDGIEALGRALEIYSTTGATWDSRRVRGWLRALGVRRRFVAAERPTRGWGALTDAELEVVRLVAHGLTNREAAERLYVSPHTVSTHLRHAFAKLDVNSRVELTRIALREDQPV